MKQFSNFLFASLLVVLAVNLVGCSDGKLKTEPVRGIVTLDGVPLEDASVNFTPKNPGEGTASFGRTNAKGEYLLQTLLGNVDAGTLPGEYVVTVSKHIQVPTGRRIEDSNSGEMQDEMDSILIFPEMAKYANTKTTPFSATVVKGKNQFDFDLKSE